MKYKQLQTLLLLVFIITACSKKDDIIANPPVVITSNVLVNGPGKLIQVNGSIYSTKYALTEYGTCWSSGNTTPTKSDNIIVEKLGRIFFASNIHNLTPGTTYYVRAYAGNGYGVGYGDVVSVTIPSSTIVYGDVTTFVGSTTPGFADGKGNAAQFDSPVGLSLNAAGELYVADSFNNAIRKISLSGEVVTIAGTGIAGYKDGDVKIAQFYAPSGVAADAAGNLYVADRGNHAIRKISANGVVSTLAGTGFAGFADGTGNKARFHAPSGLAVDASGNVYVADAGNYLIRKITPAGVVSTFAGSRKVGHIDATGIYAYFNRPNGISIDAAGNLYVAEALNYTVRKIDPSAVVTTVAGGPKALPLLGAPVSAAIGKNGALIIVDSRGRVLLLGPDRILRTLAGKTGVAGYLDGNGLDALLSSPQGVATDNSGNIYIADHENHCVRMIVVQ